MAPFKHIDLDTGHPKRKRTTNPKLLDDNNMSLEAIKRRKLESSTVPAASTSKSSSAKPNRQASVEAIADEDDMRGRNAGHPKNPRLILESVDDDDDDDDKLTHPAPKKTQTQILADRLRLKLLLMKTTCATMRDSLRIPGSFLSQ